MSRIRINTKKSLVSGPPTCINFSEIEESLEEMGESFSPGDDGEQSLSMEEDLAQESMVYNILSNLDDKDRIIFLIQLLRDCGYRIDHGSFARAIGMSRTKYMGLLGDLKIKMNLYLIGEKLGLITKSKQ